MKTISQEEVWDNIANPWKKFKSKPIPIVINFLKNKKGKILDLCCGTGRNFTKIDGTIYGIDFSENMLKYAKQFADKEKIKVILKKSGADKIPFEENFFDAAVYIASLQCLASEKERKNSLKELYRVLKPKAEAIITVWNKAQEKFRDAPKQNFISWKVKGKGEFKRYYYFYDKQEFETLLKEIGFKIIKLLNAENPEGFYSKRNLIAVVKK